MIKLAKKIISKPNPYYDSSGQGRSANPIDAYFKEEVVFRLSRLFRKESNDEKSARIQERSEEKCGCRT